MKKIVLSLAFIALVTAAVPNAGAATRMSVSFGYGNSGCYYRPVYSYPVVVRAYPRYRYKRFHGPYYSRVYFRHRPHARIVVGGCY